MDAEPELPPIIDLEASGFGAGSYPIEVGFILPWGGSYCSLIRPAPHWTHWDPAAEKLHHVTPQILALHGKPARDVALVLNERLREQVVYSDGWANDYSWLGLLFDEVGLRPAFRLENLRRILSEDEAARWHSAKDEVLERTSHVRHRASTDARVIQETLALLRAGKAFALR